MQVVIQSGTGPDRSRAFPVQLPGVTHAGRGGGAGQRKPLDINSRHPLILCSDFAVYHH